MEKFVMTPIPDEDQVVLDVPEGRLRMDFEIHDNGEGLMLFSIAKEYERPGAFAKRQESEVPALKLVVQSPEKANAIAHAFLAMADAMEDFADDEDDDDDEDEIGYDDPEDDEEEDDEEDSGSDTNKAAGDLVDLIKRLFPGISILVSSDDDNDK